MGRDEMMGNNAGRRGAARCSPSPVQCPHHATWIISTATMMTDDDVPRASCANDGAERT